MKRITFQILHIGKYMSAVTTNTDEMRQPAEWMVPTDDRILELIREEGNLTPGAIEVLGGPSSDHASRRAKKLSQHGLLEQIHRGLYRLTDEGRAYLDEELDAADLEPVE